MWPQRQWQGPKGGTCGVHAPDQCYSEKADLRSQTSKWCAPRIPHCHKKPQGLLYRQRPALSQLSPHAPNGKITRPGLEHNPGHRLGAESPFSRGLSSSLDFHCLLCFSLLSFLTSILHRSPKSGNTTSPLCLSGQVKLAAGPPLCMCAGPALCHGHYYVPRSSYVHKQQ